MALKKRKTVARRPAGDAKLRAQVKKLVIAEKLLTKKLQAATKDLKKALLARKLAEAKVKSLEKVKKAVVKKAIVKRAVARRVVKKAVAKRVVHGAVKARKTTARKAKPAARHLKVISGSARFGHQKIA